MAASNLLPKSTRNHFHRPYMFDTFLSALFVGLLAGVNNTLIFLTNFLRSGRYVQGVQDHFYGCSGALDFFVQYQCSSKLNRKLFSLEISF